MLFALAQVRAKIRSCFLAVKLPLIIIRFISTQKTLINIEKMISKTATKNIKAIAISMVLFGHLVSAKKIDINIAWIDIATFGVSMFLFISGYGLYKSQQENGMKGYFQKKIISIYIPFAIATFLVGASRGFWSDKWGSMLKTVTFTAPSLPVDGTMWYIYYISMWYLIFFLSIKIAKQDHIRILILLTASILIFIIPFNKKYGVLTFLFSFHAFTFTLGVAVAMCRPVSKRVMLIIGITLLCIFIYLFHLHFVKYNALNHVMASIVAAPSIIFIISYFDINWKPLTFIGGISFEMYLFEGALRWNTFAPDKTSSCIIFFLITVSCAYTFQHFIKVVKRPF